MAMNTRVPMVGNGAEALQKGVEHGTNLFQQFIGHGINQGRMHQHGQQFDKTLGFNEKQLAQQHTHHLNEMGVRYKQIEHAEKLLPHQIQHMIDQHVVTPYQAMNLYAQAQSHIATAKKNMMFANLLDSGSDQGMDMPGMQSNMPAQPPMMQAPMQPPMAKMPGQMQPNMAMQGPMAQPPLQRPGFENQQNIDIPYQPQAQQSMAQPVAQPVAQRVTPEQVKQEVAQEGGFIDPADLKPGQTVTIRPAEPNKAKLDRAAGLMGIPNVVPTVVDGVQYERWPSGKLTATRTGASPEQKAELETNKKEQQEINKRHAVERQKLEEELPRAKEVLGQIEDLEKLYIKNKGHEKEWWGVVPPICPEKFHKGMREYFINDKEYGRMKDIMGKLIANQSQEYSSRGLAAGLQMAEENKPSFFEGYETSLGKLQQLKDKAQKSIKREEGRLKELQGGKGDKSEATSEGGSQALVVIDVDGKIARVPIKRVDGFMMKYPTGKIINEPR